MAFFQFLASLFGFGAKATTGQTSPSPAEAMRGLRMMMLTTPAAEAGMLPTERFPKVFGVVMDMPISNGHTATIVSMCDGNASLYTTSTFGVLGGIGHESVRNASMQFVEIAQAHYDQAASASDFPYPVGERVRFYLLGFEGVRVIETSAAALTTRNDPFSSLWAAGQFVLNELRLVSEKN